MNQITSPKRRIKQNRYDNWYGYEGARKAVGFNATPEDTQQSAAELWLKTGKIDPRSTFTVGVKSK